MARRAACLLAALLGSTSSPARAATVVLVQPEGPRWRVAELRVRDELRALGMTVTESRPRRTDDGAMNTLLAEHAAVAAVQISRTSDRADVTLWLADPAAAAPRRVTLAVDDGQHAGIAALRTAELVRTETLPSPEPAPIADAAREASLVPLPPWNVAPATSAIVPAPQSPPAENLGPAPPPTSQPSPSQPPTSQSSPSPSPDASAPLPIAPRSTEPRPLSELVDDLPPAVTAEPTTMTPRHHGILVAATLGGGPGGAGVLPGLELAARRELTRRLEFGGGVFSLVSPTWKSDDRGSILLGLVAARAQLGLRWQFAPRLSLRLALGGGLALVWAVGRADSPYRGATSISPVGILSTALSFVIRLGPRTSLHTGAAVDVVLPPLVIRSAGIEAFQIGQPLVRGILGIAWDWPLRGPRPRAPSP